MKSSNSMRSTVAGFLLAPLLLIGCSTEHVQEPWVTEEQSERLEGQIARDDETATELRERLATTQTDR